MSLAPRAARGTSVTVFGQVLKFAIQASSILILARIIPPAEFGVFTMVAAIAALAAVVGDFGLSFAAIQAPIITAKERTNLFWLNLCIGALGSGTMFACAPLIADFYGEPRLTPVAQWMSLSFILLSLAVQHRAQLTREMRFGLLAGAEIAAQAVGLAVAVPIALSGAGVMALVAQQLTAYGVLLVTALLGARWLPGLPSFSTSIRSYVRYGSHTMGGALVNYASTNVDKIAIGASASAADLGIYGRMYQLFSLPLQQLAAPLTRVALPTLSKLLQEPRRYEAFLVRAQLCLAYSFGLGFAFIFGTANELVPLVLGPGWQDGISVLQVLCIGGFFQGIGYVNYWVFLSRGRMDIQLWLGIATRSITVVAVILASTISILWVAGAVAAGLVLNWIVYSTLGMRMVGLRPSVVLRNALWPMIISIPAAILLSWISEYLQISMSAGLPVLVASATLLIYVGVCVVLIPQVRRDARAIVATMTMAVRRTSQ
ncbi:lipopolysaccharide biosynthesis protein [Agromyces indicus]|uniref:Lipopolysaccharide biosynthesis protein n=1 Tax=Agromyces indicus TaxID=758919 RepID=A0ABU1FII7_9MICO|nr:lipopolysaccharide biosynthesis protein [Agromyces indicus]MDR5691577.1 lipopolysaccharide biosynthesis protein [Agromyces indicus]